MFCRFIRKPLTQLSCIRGPSLMTFPANGFIKSEIWNETSILVRNRSSRTRRQNFIQPVFNVEYLIENLEQYKTSIQDRKRKVIPEPDTLVSMYTELKVMYDEMNTAKTVMDEHEQHFLIHCLSLPTQQERDNDDKYWAMESKFERLQEIYNEASDVFDRMNYILVDMTLSFPNFLDDKTPRLEPKFLGQTSSQSEVPIWIFPKYKRRFVPPGVSFEFPEGYEVPTRASALDEVYLFDQARVYLFKEEYEEFQWRAVFKTEFINAKWVDPKQFLEAQPISLVEDTNVADLLTNGLGLPLFVGDLGQRLILDELYLPLRYFQFFKVPGSLGPGLGKYQRRMVHVLVVCRTEIEMEQEFEKLSLLMQSFYFYQAGIPVFQTVLVDASGLKIYERKCLKFFINSNNETSGGVEIGSIATCGDYVSKRIVTKYIDKDGNYKYPLMVCAMFIDATNFLRANPPNADIRKDSENLADPSITTKQDS